MSMPRLSAPADAAAAFAVLLLDENRIFADVLAMRLRGQRRVRAASVAGSLEEARPVLASLRPEVVLVDYGERGELALRLLADLSTDDAVAVVVLSGVQDDRAVLAALSAGARGWVTKDATFATLWEALREVRAGHLVISPAVLEPVVARALDQHRQAPAPARRDFVADLTPREYEVLQCLVSGMDKKEVAARLFLSVNTVRTHVQHLLRHADEHTTLALVAAARELGVPGYEGSRSPSVRLRRVVSVQKDAQAPPES